MLGFGQLHVPPWRRWVLRHIPAPLLKEPFLLWLALACILTAGAQLAGATEPNAYAQLLPRLALKAWQAELLIGGTLTLVGVCWSKPRILILGLQPLGLAALAYSVGVLYLAGSRAILSVGITVAFSLACFFKAFTYSTAAYGAQFPSLPDGEG